MSKRGNDPAGPCFEPNENGYGNAIVFEHPNGNKSFVHFNQGMTIREQFAAMALQGLCSNSNWANSMPIELCNAAIVRADILIRELEKR